VQLARVGVLAGEDRQPAGRVHPPTFDIAGGRVPTLGLTTVGETEIVVRIALRPFGIAVFRIAES
jgi:hypothetical protein